MTRALDLNLRHLRAVHAIAACGSVAAAAVVVGRSQPAVTAALAGVEAAVGRLFDRHSTGMRATAAGMILVLRIGAALARLDATIRNARALSTAQVGAVIAVARAGSYVGAASATGAAAPTLHRAVGEVEAIAGLALIERRGRGIAITAAGARVARGFRLALAEIDAGLADLADAGGAARGHVAIGAMPLARARLVPLAVAALCDARPDATVAIVEGRYDDLVERLRDADLAFLVGAARDRVAPDIVQLPLFTDRLVVVARAGHPLADTMPSPAQMTGFRWIVGRAGTPLRDQWQRRFGGAAAPVECGSVIAIRGLLLASDLLTLLSPDQVAVEVAAGLLTIVGPPLVDTPRSISITTRADWVPSRLEALAIEQLRATAAGA